MTSIKILGQLGLLVGLALVLTTGSGADHGPPPKRILGELTIFDGKDAFGYVVCDDDRFVALHFRKGEGIYLHNFQKSGDRLEVDGKDLGYDLDPKNKNVLVREKYGKDTQWEFVRGEEKTPFRGYFRAKNGELKGWWIGLGPIEPAKKGSKLPRDQYPRAPLILVKDKKEAAGFSYSLDPPDDGR
jgi:hypothetical protein